jgi:hypothetical protein
MLEFKQDWALLQYSRERNSAAASALPASSSLSAAMLAGGRN